MAEQERQSNNILRVALIILATLSVIFMPPSNQGSMLGSIADILISIVVPIAAPIAFVILLMDIVIYSATATNSDNKWQKSIMTIEGLLCMLILLRWLPYVLSPLR